LKTAFGAVLQTVRKRQPQHQISVFHFARTPKFSWVCEELHGEFEQFIEWLFALPCLFGLLSQHKGLTFQSGDAFLVGAYHRVGSSLDHAIKQLLNLPFDLRRFVLTARSERLSLRDPLFPGALEHGVSDIDQ
jgi:hypothetical protein